MDKSLIEASYDLGANKTTTFFKTIIPMTMPGIISASMMVFMPTMSSFVISDVMGERKIQLIGNTIQFNFDQMRWHEGSFIAFIMLLIIGFGYLYTYMQLKPNELADNLNKNGGYIPGIRPGKDTEKYIKTVLSRITIVGASFLALLAGIPILFGKFSSIGTSISISGTGLLIVVGVALETYKQLEGSILTRSYKRGYSRR
mgnify:CR=1 FL=1